VALIVPFSLLIASRGAPEWFIINQSVSDKTFFIR